MKALKRFFNYKKNIIKPGGKKINQTSREYGVKESKGERKKLMREGGKEKKKESVTAIS